MGQIEKLKLITKAKIEAFLETLEKPELILPQLINELSAKLQQAANAEAKALSVVKADQRRLDEANGMVMRFEKGASQAVKANDIEMARQAISAQLQAEGKVSQCKKTLTISQSAFKNAHQVRIQLEENLKDLKIKKTELLKRSRQTKLRSDLIQKNSFYDNHKTESILDAVARIQAKVDLDESTVQIQNEIAKTLGPSFDLPQLEKIENQAEVEKRLNLLRRDCSKNS